MQNISHHHMMIRHLNTRKGSFEQIPLQTSYILQVSCGYNAKVI